MKSLVYVLLIFLFASCTDVLSCTAFYVVSGDTIVVGNNEDYFTHKTKMWFVPSENGIFGRVYFGFDNYWPQGGMNEKGLFFDGFATAPKKVLKSKNKPVFQGNLLDKAMAECATVDEVIELAEQYNLEFLERAMLMFGDAQGNSAILEGDEFVRKTGYYQVCTNFYQSETPQDRITCWRYLKTSEMLNANPHVSIELARDILKAVHVDITQYSNVYDLKDRIVYLYHFHDFDHVVRIDLADELKKGSHSADIPALFPAKEEFIKRFESKLTPLNSKILFFFLILSGIIFAVSPFVLPLGWRKMKEESENPSAIEQLYLPAQMVCSAACVLVLVYLLAIAAHPQVLTFGLPQTLAGLPVFLKMIVQIPLITILLCAVLLLLLVAVYLRKKWTGFLRGYFSTITILLLIHLAFFGYWDLIVI